MAEKTTTVTPGYEVWHDLLTGKAVQVHADSPQLGFWWVRQNGKRRPLAISIDTKTGTKTAVLGIKADYQTLGPPFGWPQAARHPLSYEDWSAVFYGGEWPDEAPPALASTKPVVPANAIQPAEAVAAKARPEPEPAPQTIGSNNPPEEGTLEAYLEELEALRARRSYVADDLSSQQDADKAANLLDNLRSLEQRLTATYDLEWRPVDETLKAVRARWSPLREGVSTAMADLKGRISSWMKAEKERQRREAAAAIAAGQVPDEPKKVQAGGAGGRKMGARQVWSANVTDWNLLLGHLRENPDLREVAQRLADAAARGGIAMPGTERVERTI